MRDRFSKHSSAVGAAVLAVALSACAKSHDADRFDAGQSGIEAGGGGTSGTSGSAGVTGGGGSGRVGGNAGATGVAGGAGRGVGGRTGGGAGTTLTAGRGGSAGAGSVSHNVAKCMPCQAATVFTGTLEACCTTDNKCGVDLSSVTGTAACAQQNAPGAQTNACPSTDYMGFITIPGCCRADGVCGLLIQQIAPLGCAQASDIAAVLGMATTTTTRCTP